GANDHARRHGDHQAGGRDVISIDTETAEGRANWPEASLDALAEAPVEHRGLLVAGGPLQGTRGAARSLSTSCGRACTMSGHRPKRERGTACEELPSGQDSECRTRRPRR